ncbi:LytR/AlgR family response regulator transcription factor [Streptomyces durbertensis]|uniref:LytR/AlgR family response regulator transcription factor n=1 Tax=Streptomyces durbertensis TaxID=2448886 RepID=UPI002B1EB6F9|nr:LytTR family DNA-binding domain-containing protein [Streptomyces durbertensis]
MNHTTTPRGGRQGASAAAPGGGLHVLVVEDEPSTRADLVEMLTELPEIGEVSAAESGEAAVRLLGGGTFDAVFLDISMPGLDGMDVARVVSMLSAPPTIVFVTASESHAIEAFGIGAVDYLLKPVRPERLSESVARIARRGRGGASSPVADELAVVQIEHSRRTVFVRRDDIQYAEAHGDYVRLHTAEDTHLIRLSLSYLEEVWAPAGFVRVHRGYLVAVGWVHDLRVTSSAGLVACTPAGDVPVSRRHARGLKEQLIDAARSGMLGRAAR